MTDAAGPSILPCPVCDTPGRPEDRYCEECGFDHSTAPTEDLRGVTWVAVVAADRAYYDRVSSPDGIRFPASRSETWSSRAKAPVGAAPHRAAPTPTPTAPFSSRIRASPSATI